MSSKGPPGVVRHIAKIQTPDNVRPPSLLRIVRDEDGYEGEERWFGTTKEWGHSHVLIDYSFGEDIYDELIDVSPEQATQIQAA